MQVVHRIVYVVVQYLQTDCRYCKLKVCIYLQFKAWYGIMMYRQVA